LGDVEDGRAEGVTLEAFGLKVLDEEEQGHDTLDAIEQLSEAAVR
jgi:hypothetical protein